MGELTTEKYLDYIGDDRVTGYLFRQYDGEISVGVSPLTVKACEGNVYDAYLLSQIIYWHGIGQNGKPRIKHKFKDNWWVVKTHQEWADNLGLNSHRTVGQCFGRLARKGYIIKERHKSPYHEGQVVTFVRLNWETYLNTVSQFSGSTYHRNPESTHDSKPGDTYHREPIPETTPEITTEGDTPTPTAQIFTHYATLTDNITPYIRDAISDLIDDHGETAVLAAVESAVEATPANPLRWMESHLGETSPGSQDKPEYTPLVEAYRNAVNMVTSYTPTGKDATAFAELHAAGITPQQLSDFINEISHDEYWRGKRLPVSVCARDIGAWLKAQSATQQNGQAWTGRALGDRPLGAGIRFANENENATGSSE